MTFGGEKWFCPVRSKEEDLNMKVEVVNTTNRITLSKATSLSRAVRGQSSYDPEYSMRVVYKAMYQ
jgi:hypothetical protein